MNKILDLLDLDQEGLRSQQPFREGAIASLLWTMAVEFDWDLQNT